MNQTHSEPVWVWLNCVNMCVLACTCVQCWYDVRVCVLVFWLQVRAPSVGFLLSITHPKKCFPWMGSIDPVLWLSDTLWCRASSEMPHLFINWQSQADRPCGPLTGIHNVLLLNFFWTENVILSVQGLQTRFDNSFEHGEVYTNVAIKKPLTYYHLTPQCVKIC